MKNGNKTKGQPIEERVVVPDLGEQSVTSLAKRHSEPIRLFIITIVSIFVAEAIIMFILPILPPLPVYSKAILDAFLLTCLVFPMLYLFSFRPMILHITQRKRAEEALKKQDKERIRFINALIHKIKTPLTAMLASSELLREELADSSLLSALAENLDIAARNLNRRISELMDFAKLQSTEPLLRSQPVDIHQLAQQAAAQVTALLKNKGQILNFELPASLPQLEADPDRVVQTLLNLAN